MSEERSTLYRQRAREMEQRAALARTEELGRAYLILARDWHEMAELQMEIASPSLAPMGALERLANELQAEAEMTKQN